MRLSLVLFALLFAAAPRVAVAQGPNVVPGYAGGGVADGASTASRKVSPEAARVRRIPIRAPFMLPNAGFPLFGLSESRSSFVTSREADSDASVAAAIPAPEPKAETVEPMAGRVRTRTETEYYAIEGDSFADLSASLRKRGPNVRGHRFFGMTEWEVSAGYRPVEEADACRIDGLTVDVAITTHLPRWSRSATVPEALREAWGRFLQALDQHEHGHRALAAEAGEAIRHRLLATSAPACDRLDAVAQRAMAAVMQEYEARNVAYDARTEHGRTQGAVW